ncbi:NTPase [Spirochaetia bacterium]|nr:NTPase [Spirochaetia bacterium]
MSENNKNVIEVNTYPHFISSKPCGIDKFEGKSQERLTKAIANHIRKIDSVKNQYQVPRIIGLEGTWGAGKSNVIKQVKKELGSEYYVFEYDAWGHQEDLQRRAFLETLTIDLINEKILSGNIEVSFNGEKRIITWQEKLNRLLSKNTITTNKSIPKFNGGASFTALALALTTLTLFISEHLEAQCIIKNILILTIIAFAPVLLGIITWLILMISHKEMRHIGYLVQITKNESSETTNYETINEDEPTVAKFKEWMEDISDHIGARESVKLIIVFDNMDRLPAEKVKELWSSIHTFFSEDGFENIWTIIPFDIKHLSCAFGEDSSEGKESNELTKYFIAKTFPIVYRVMPPVLTDYKNIFNNLFKEAFGDTENTELEDISRIFRLEKPDSTIREMIIFINQLVSLKTVWNDEINILDMAIFCLKQDVIMKNPVSEILSGDFLGKEISKIISNDSTFQKNISALVYGVSPDEAEQIPLSKYIENSLKSESEYDINQYSSNKHYITLLDDTIRNTDVSQIDFILHGLNQLEITPFNEVQQLIIKNLWIFLAEQKIKELLKEQKMEESYKTLLVHVDENYQQKIIKHICKQIQSFAGNEFSGTNYYTALNDLESFLNENNINISIELQDIERVSDIFIDYVSTAKDNYINYKLSVNSVDLDEYFVKLVPDKLSETKIVILSYLDKKVYVFPRLIKSIENIIATDKVTSKNAGEIFYVYKQISDKKPLVAKLNDARIQTLWTELSTQQTNEAFSDVAAMQLSTGQNINLTDKQIEKVAECMDYYTNYGELLIKAITQNIPSLTQVLKYMTENKMGYILSFNAVLPQFTEIVKILKITEKTFLEQLNRWSNHKEDITVTNIQTLIPNPEFFKHSVEIQNDLTTHINKTAGEALSAVDIDYFYQQRVNFTTDYWFQLTNHLLNTVYLKTLPSNLTDSGIKILKDISAGAFAVPQPDNLMDKILNTLDSKKTKAHIKDIKDSFCNSEYIITPQIFVYFESRFEKLCDLKNDHPDRVAHKIIEPVLNDSKCLQLILSKTDYYSQIINNAGDDATEVKNIISKKLQGNTDVNLIVFAKKIGITNEETQ